MTNLDMGFDTDDLLAIKMEGIKNEEALYHQVAQIAGVKSITTSRFLPGIEGGWTPSVEFERNTP
ncbi:hypothetical protein [Arthrospiribacter ruber]|uniref:Uncharacterized protein n=1 Tax=Arthrospiribacter ruber TaxID=2487934 RepID=A0A951J259_9BACT|nr:hypothetical protein [Arthrospiribacter ruber]MBW3469553.1 hypothetical protein [Arthrospiribacter ruber]